jgi:hypothetical protein
MDGHRRIRSRSLARASGHKTHLRVAAIRMAAETGMGASSSPLRADSGGRNEVVISMLHEGKAGAQNVNKHGTPSPRSHP